MIPRERAMPLPDQDRPFCANCMPVGTLLPCRTAIFRCLKLPFRRFPGRQFGRDQVDCVAELGRFLGRTISVRGDPAGIRDEPFTLLDRLHRRVVLTVPHMLAAPLIVANTDLVALVFERIARQIATQLKLMIFEPPIPLPEFTANLLTSAARVNDPGLNWLIDQVRQVSAP